jgi:hypothetical protein
MGSRPLSASREPLDRTELDVPADDLMSRSRHVGSLTCYEQRRLPSLGLRAGPPGWKVYRARMPAAQAESQRRQWVPSESRYRGRCLRGRLPPFRSCLCLCGGSLCVENRSPWCRRRDTHGAATSISPTRPSGKARPTFCSFRSLAFDRGAMGRTGPRGFPAPPELVRPVDLVRSAGNGSIRPRPTGRGTRARAMA